ncbi:MAG: DUF3617 family protein [Pseudomonadota bacterium]
MRALLAVPLLLAAGAPAPVLQPGLWEIAGEPGVASLDGKPLADLPYTSKPPERVCLTAAEASAPAKWLARDTPGDCTITAAKLTRGKVDIRGTCPPPDEDRRAGSLRLTGRYTATGYDLRFATTAHGDNGTMGFSGRLTGKRVGACS